MKRTALIIGLVIISLNVFAQAKGEKYLFAMGYASFGKVKVENFNGVQVNNYDRPLSKYLGVQAGFGFFPANNFSLELGVGVPYTKELYGRDGDTWLYEKVLGVELNPRMAFYVKLADRFYYTPKLGGTFVFGTDVTDVSSYKSEKYDYQLLGAYVEFLAFQFRVSQKFAIGAMVGQMSYRRVKVSEHVSGAYSAANRWRFDLNSFTVSTIFCL